MGEGFFFMENNNTGELRNAADSQESVSETQSVQERMVPLSALEDERAKRQRLEEEQRYLKEQWLAQQKSQPQSNELDGLEDSDIMTVGEFKKISKKIKEEFSTSLKEIQMTHKYPDYVEVIGTYLPDIVKNHPHLKDTLLKTQDYELAYFLAKNSDAYRQDQQNKNKNQDAERILKNTQQAGSLASVGASTPVSQMKRYKDMSDEEFRKEVAKNMGY